MKAICYTNTKTTLPNWIEPLHESQPYGFAYENNSFFIHFYGTDKGIQTISPGLTVVEKKHNNQTLKNWVVNTFGATNIKKMNSDVGTAKKLIWRPGLLYYDELKSALDYDEFDKKCRWHTSVYFSGGTAGHHHRASAGRGTEGLPARHYPAGLRFSGSGVPLFRRPAGNPVRTENYEPAGRHGDPPCQRNHYGSV